MVNKQQILDILKNKKDAFNIDNFVLFGSFAVGNNHKNSDIDIAYILKKNSKLSFDKYIKLEEELYKSFKQSIDLMNFKKINPLVKLHAQKDFIYV
jgi:predicted nucleotidyltransferase